MYRYRLTIIICLAEIFGLTGFATFSALLPQFMLQWNLTNTEAGWISAVYYAAYMISVPLLVGITDRVDARRIMAFGAIIAAMSSIGFAFYADGFFSALTLRFLAGVSLAGVYTPGVKLVSDHNEGPLQSRHVSLYTASFSIGASISYLIAGEINKLADWQWAFGLSSLGPLLSVLLIAFYIPGGKITRSGKSHRIRVDFKPVLKTREAMAYILAYAAHMWELFSLRSWIVVFLYYSQSLQAPDSVNISPTQVAFLINLIGLPASVGGNEISHRFGRRKTVIIIMVMSILISAVIGFTPSLPYLLVVTFCIVYGIVVLGDSASLTAGAVAAAPAGYRGATLALHSTLGFGAAFLGPLAVGVVLDVFRDSGTLAWGMAFLTMGLGCAMGPVVLLVSGGKRSSKKTPHAG